MKDMKNMKGKFNNLTENVIGSAIEIHKALGPGLMESAYQQCLAHELKLRGISFQIEYPFSCPSCPSW